MSSDRLETLMNQAEELVQAKKYEEAIAIFEQMLRDFPQSAKVWSKYGQTLALPEVNREEEAYSSFKKARQIDPNDKKNLSRYCKFLQDPNRFNRSKNLLSIIYEDLLHLEPSNVVTLTGYGKALIKEGEYEKEKGEYEKAQVKYEKAIGILREKQFMKDMNWLVEIFSDNGFRYAWVKDHEGVTIRKIAEFDMWEMFDSTPQEPNKGQLLKKTA